MITIKKLAEQIFGDGSAVVAMRVNALMIMMTQIHTCVDAQLFRVFIQRLTLC